MTGAPLASKRWLFPIHRVLLAEQTGCTIKSLGGGLPVSVGMSLVCKESSSGFKRLLMLGIARHR